MSVHKFVEKFQLAGPVASQFIRDRDNVVRAMLGPVGAGKTVTCIFDCLKNAISMPVCIDGIIRYRVAIIGDTYGQMERNLFPSWNEWIPRDGGSWADGEFKGGGGRFATHKLSFGTPRGDKIVPVKFEAIFAAIGDNVVEEFMRGFEPTAFWLYEMDLLAEDVLDQGLFRIGRYPRQALMPTGVDFRSYIIGDLNAPDVDSWFYRRFEEDRPKGHKLYRQPSGRSPRAENITNLPRGYYDRQVEVMSGKAGGKYLIKRMVDAEYAPSLDGEPVYPEFSDDVHMSPVELEPIKGVPLKLGFDQGLRRPACLIAQKAPNGQYRILSEVVPGRMSARRFADEVKREIGIVAPHWEIEIGYADPAGFIGADKEDNEFSWAEIVANELQILIEPAPSNELDLRIGAVTDELTYMIEPNVPALLISPRCKMLRKGGVSHYRYKKERVGSGSRTSNKPEKNDWSDPHDALQYLLLGDKGRYGVVYDSRERRGKSKGQRRIAGSNSNDGGSIKLKSNYNPLA